MWTLKMKQYCSKIKLSLDEFDKLSGEFSVCQLLEDSDVNEDAWKEAADE